MLPQLDGHLQTLVVRDVIVVLPTDHSIHHLDVASEHLVQVATLPMGLRATCNRRCKVALCQRLTHHRDVVVEVAPDDDRGMRVLLDDVLGDLDHSLGTVFELLLLSWLDVAVEYLYDVVPNLQLCPA